jgi:hypothetical protein
MTDAILGNRFASSRAVPWWDMGWQPDAANVDLATAVSNAQADYDVEKWEMVAVIRDDEGNITQVEDTSAMALMREPLDEDNQYRYFGSVTQEYKILQNRDLARLLQPVNDVYAVETVGVIEEGKTAFFCFDAGEYEINDEKNKHYLFASTGHNGKTGVNLGLSKVCIVCSNTHMMALNSSAVSFKIAHKGDVEEATSNAVTMLTGLERVIATDIKRDTQLGVTKVNQDEAVELIRGAYPDPRPPRGVKKVGSAIASESMTKEQVKRLLSQQGGVGRLAETWERQKERVQLLRDTTVQVYGAYEKGRPSIHGTALGVWNSVTEIANYREGQNADRSIMFGGVRAKTMDLAYDNITKFAGVNG